MTSNLSFQESMRSLVKIIYEKEKQIQKYKNLVNKSQASKTIPFSDQSNISKQIKQASRMILALQKKVDSVNNLLCQQIQQNRQLQQSNSMMRNQINNMRQEKRKLLQNEQSLQKELQKIKLANEQLKQKSADATYKKEQQFNISTKYKNLLEQVNKANQKTVKQYQSEIQNYQLKVQSLQNQLNEMEDTHKLEAQHASVELQQNNAKQKQHIIQLQKVNMELGKKIKMFQLQADSLNNQINQTKAWFNDIYFFLQEIASILKMQSLSWHNISKQQYTAKILNAIKNRLTEEDNKVSYNQTDVFINETLHGISRIKESFQAKLQQLNDDQFNTSQFQVNQDMLIQNLQKQCEAASNHSKLVQLSQVKENLKMTKQVNTQLFDQINRQQKVIREFKSSFKNFLSLNKEKLANLEQIKNISQLISQH